MTGPMTIPMILLAVGSVGAGAFLIIGQPVRELPRPGHRGAADRARPVDRPGHRRPGARAGGRRPGLGDVRTGTGPAAARRGRFPVVAARKDLYGDAINESVLMRPGQWLTRLSVYFDNRGVDGLVNTLAAAVGGPRAGSARRRTASSAPTRCPCSSAPPRW
jgi:NADH-quinone oxidoreductase subunit L